MYTPDKIQKQIDAVAALDDKVCVVRCTPCSVNEAGEPIFRPQRQISGVFSAEQMMNMHSLKEVSLYGCTLLIHRDILAACGSFSEELRAVQDEEYWANIMFRGYRFVSLSDVLVKIRVHGNQATVRLHDRFDAERLVMTKHISALYREHPKATERMMEYYTYKQIKERRKDCAALAKQELLAVSGWSMRRWFGYVGYGVYGALYSFVKRCYRLLFVRRHRN